MELYRLEIDPQKRFSSEPSKTRTLTCQRVNFQCFCSELQGVEIRVRTRFNQLRDQFQLLFKFRHPCSTLVKAQLGTLVFHEKQPPIKSYLFTQVPFYLVRNLSSILTHRVLYKRRIQEDDHYPPSQIQGKVSLGLSLHSDKNAKFTHKKFFSDEFPVYVVQ